LDQISQIDGVEGVETPEHPIKRGVFLSGHFGMNLVKEVASVNDVTTAGRRG
jgi:hypothetical protein